MSFRRIGAGLPELVNQWIDDPLLRERVVLQAWDRMCGSTVAAHTRVIGLDAGVLRVAVDDRRWHGVLREMGGLLLRRLRGELGAESVREIRIEGPDDQPGRDRAAPGT